MTIQPAAICVVLLAGGAGTRIRHLYPDLPKPLIPVAGRPFLEWICRYWAAQGLKQAIVSLGHKAAIAEKQLDALQSDAFRVRSICEPEPLGTGGAVRLAANSGLCTDPFAVANGDSLVFADLSDVWDLLGRDDVDGLVVGARVPSADRFGSLSIGDDGKLRGFREKVAGRGIVNAGIYFFKKQLLALFPDRTPLSMEQDVFPELLRCGARIRVHLAEGDFLDMGTPEGLAQSGNLIHLNRSRLERTYEARS